MAYKEDDISKALPAWQDFINGVKGDMSKAGFEAIAFDVVRTAEEAERNAAKGTGIKDSMHGYECATDFICAKHGWQCKAKKCRFFEVLGVVIEKRGGLWGGRFPKVDQPHSQGVSIAMQKEMRALGKGPEARTKRNALVVKFLGRKR